VTCHAALSSRSASGRTAAREFVEAGEANFDFEGLAAAATTNCDKAAGLLQRIVDAGPFGWNEVV
jgi:hypothetical protein